MKRNRTRLLLIAASLASFLLVGWTLAAWTVSGVADNVISTAGTLGGKIDEIYTEPGEIYPGAVVDKVVNVKNTGNIDLLARVKISYAWGDSRGPAPDRVLNKNNLDTGNIKIQTDTTFWTNGGDGWYYYKGVIAPANTSLKPLFEKFTLDAVSTTDEYRGKTADIKVDLECIQVPGNAAEAVWGKPYSFFGIEEPKAPAGSTASVSFVDPASGFAFDKGIDLFINMKEMYPGETRVQPIEVKNTYTQAAEIFLRADYIGQTGDTARIEKLLKEYATVIITAGGKTIYNGAV